MSDQVTPIFARSILPTATVGLVKIDANTRTEAPDGENGRVQIDATSDTDPTLIDGSGRIRIEEIRGAIGPTLIGASTDVTVNVVDPTILVDVRPSARSSRRDGALEDRPTVSDENIATISRRYRRSRNFV